MIPAFSDKDTKGRFHVEISDENGMLTGESEFVGKQVIMLGSQLVTSFSHFQRRSHKFMYRSRSCKRPGGA